jgi:hypothetical protein
MYNYQQYIFQSENVSFYISYGMSLIAGHNCNYIAESWENVRNGEGVKHGRQRDAE